MQERIPRGYSASFEYFDLTPTGTDTPGRRRIPREGQKTTLVRSAKFESLKPSFGVETPVFLGSAEYFDLTGQLKVAYEVTASTAR